MYNPPQEILDLANHHAQIIERRFYYECVLNQRPDCLLRVQTVRKKYEDSTRMILVVKFSLSSIQAMIGRVGMTTLWWLPPLDSCDVILDLNYADPKFTDNTLSDLLKKLEYA